MNHKPLILTMDQLQKIAEMRQQGYSTVKIAAAIGVPVEEIFTPEYRGKPDKPKKEDREFGVPFYNGR